MSTDYSSQQNLTPYYRMDIYLLYKVIKGDFNLDLGFSLLNVFDHKNETSRYYDYDSSNKTIIVKSEYFNFPRFVIFEIKINYAF
jgi:hypothetical protein